MDLNLQRVEVYAGARREGLLREAMEARLGAAAAGAPTAVRTAPPARTWPWRLLVLFRRAPRPRGAT